MHAAGPELAGRSGVAVLMAEPAGESAGGGEGRDEADEADDEDGSNDVSPHAPSPRCCVATHVCETPCPLKRALFVLCLSLIGWPVELSKVPASRYPAPPAPPA